MPTLYTSLLEHLPADVRKCKRAAAAAHLEAVVLAEPILPGDHLPAQTGPRVVVVGAGLAKLSAANQPTHLCFPVTVVEAQKRLGGRVHTVDDVLSGKTIEGGGELIGSSHPIWSRGRARAAAAWTPRIQMFSIAWFPSRGGG